MSEVLIITNKSDLTSDFIVKRLKERNISFYRFNTEEISQSCFLSFDFQKNLFILSDTILRKQFNLKEFSSVYFRRPELSIINTEDLNSGEIQFLKNEFYYTLEGLYKILKDLYWVSPIYAIREAENKIYQLELAKSIGFRIPDSIVTNIYADAVDFFNRNESSYIVKPIKSSLIEDINTPKVIFTNLLKGDPQREQIELSPNLFQVHIKKLYDVRVTMVGEKAFAVLIDSQNNSETLVDWRRGEFSLKHIKIELPDKILKLCITLLKTLNLRFGAIDFILDTNGDFIFLEINPNGQWAWIEKRTGYEISNEIVNLLRYESF
jgi:glutathione synthase/RimK-type ligase-like ATP-grasp enzyme